VQVQGSGSAEQVIKALQYFNQAAEPPELIAVIRGGGSSDDLATFNDEPLVREIAASRVPTIIGVGHEVDVTLADLVCDVRAATPSNAAQLLVPDKREIISQNKRELVHVISRMTQQENSQRAYVADKKRSALDSIDDRFTRLQQQQQASRQILHQVNPSNVLRRGYAVIRASNGEALSSKSAEGLQKNDEVHIELEKVIIKAGVRNVSTK